MRSSIDVHVALSQLGIEHEIYPLPAPIRRVEEAPGLLDVPPHEVACPRVFRVSGASDLELLILYEPAVGSDLGEAVARRLASAVPGQLEAVTGEAESSLTGFLPGLVPPLPLPARTRVFIDELLAASDVLYFPSGDPGALLKIRVRDLSALGIEVLPTQNLPKEPG